MEENKDAARAAVKQELFGCCMLIGLGLLCIALRVFMTGGDCFERRLAGILAGVFLCATGLTGLVRLRFPLQALRVVQYGFEALCFTAFAVSVWFSPTRETDMTIFGLLAVVLLAQYFSRRKKKKEESQSDREN